MRQKFHKLHLWISIPLGIFFFISCLTGALLVFEKELTQRSQADLYRVTPAATPRLQPAELARRVAGQMPDTLSLASLQIFQATDKAALATFDGDSKTYAVDPYTGQVKGATSSSPFFQTVRKLHRWLLNPPPTKTAKSVGKVIMGISTLCMIVVLLTGIVCWWPKTRKMLKNRLTISAGHGRLRFWHDFHVALGLYAVLFLLLMALTGPTWSFQWYRKAAYGLFGANTPAKSAQPAASKSEQPKDKQPKAPFDYAVWNRTAAEAATVSPDYQWLKLTPKAEAEVLPDGAPLPSATDRLLTDPASGHIQSVARWIDQPRADKAKAWFYAVHTGTWGGRITQVIYLLAALIGAALPLTGYFMWYRRQKGKRKAAAKAALRA